MTLQQQITQRKRNEVNHLFVEVVINLYEIGLLILGVSALMLLKANEERKRSRES